MYEVEYINVVLGSTVERRKTGEVSNTISALNELEINEEAMDYVTGFNAKRYFSWLLETMTEEEQLGIF